MTDDMQTEVIQICNDSFERNQVEKDIAAGIKKVRTRCCPDRLTHAQELDRKYGATWHVVVGRSFGSFVTHGASLATDCADAGRDEALLLCSTSLHSCGDADVRSTSARWRYWFSRQEVSSRLR